MDYLKMIRKNNRLYLSDNTAGSNITNIYYFLNDDVGGDPQDWINWINSQTSTIEVGNYSLLLKDKENIHIGCNLDDFGGQFYQNAVMVSSISLYNLLTEWDRLVKAIPEEVTIYLEGTELRVTWR